MRLLLAAALGVGCTPESSTCTRTPGEVCVVAGSGERGFNGEGPALETHLFLPSGAAVDAEGRLLVADFNNMQIRRLQPDGTLATVAGTGLHAYATDGIVATDSHLENPIDVAAAPDGTLYVMELHGARILQVDPDGWLTVFAGSATNPGYEAYEGDGGPAREARMSQAVGLALADDGTLFFADTGHHAIRYVDPEGIVHTLAGSGEPGFVDGQGADARFDTPHHLTWADGVVYVADAGNHAVRRIDVATGAVTTLAGTGEGGFSGDGGPATEARLQGPQGVAALGGGEVVFVADAGNHVIRRIAADGTIETVLGEPGVFAPPEEGAEGVYLSRPQAVVVGRHEDLFVVDTLNDVVHCWYGGAR